MVNRYYTSKPFQGQFYTPPVDLLADVLDNAQKQYDQNYALTETLRSRKISALEQDLPRAREIQAQTDSRIDEIVKMYNGDYSRATGALRQLVSDTRKQYGTGSEVAAMEQNKTAYDLWLQGERKRVSEGKVTADDLALANQYYLGNYQGVGSPDPTTGNYNYFNPDQLAEYVDGSKMVTEALAKVKPKKIARMESVKQPNGDWYDESVEVEGIDPKEANNAVAAALMSDPKWQAYTQQAAQLRGQSPQEYMLDQIDAYQKTYVPLMSGVITDKREIKYKGLDEREKLKIQNQNAMRQIGAREAAAKRVAKYKYDLENPDTNLMSGESLLNLQRIGSNPISDFKELKLGDLSLNNGKIQPISTGFQANAEAAAASILPGSILPNPLAQAYNYFSKPTKNKVKVDDILKYGSPDVNMTLLQSVKKNNPKASDTDIVAIYNRQLAQNATTSTFMIPNPQPQEQKAAANQLIPRYQQTGAQVWEMVDGNKPRRLSVDESNEMLNKAYDHSKGHANGLVVGTTRSFTGNVPVGHVFQSADNKKYIIAETNPVLEVYNGKGDDDSGLRGKIFGHISSGATYSDVFGLPSPDGSGLTSTVGVLSYDSDGKRKVTYYPAKTDASGKVDPQSINYLDPWRKADGSLLTPEEVEKQVAGPEINFIRQRQKLGTKRSDNPGYNYDLIEQDANNQE